MGGMAALLGGQSGPPGGDPMAGAPAGPPPQDPQGGAGGGGDVSTMLKDMLDIASGYLDQEQDEQNKLTMQKVTTLLQQVLAAEEKELQDAMGGKMSPKLLSQAYGQ